MPEQAHAEWLERGRAHQWQGQPIDALLCFREAIRADARASDAHFHLGEIQWQLGRFADAIAAWRESLRIAPRFLAPAQALAEALLATGDAAGAAQAAGRVLAQAPGDVRAEFIAGVANLASAKGDIEAGADRVVRALASDPALVGVSSLALPLARALERPGARPQPFLVDEVIRAAGSAALVGAMPAALLALACERAVVTEAVGAQARASLFAHAAARSYAATEHEALRRIALAAGQAAAPEAAVLLQTYAELCVSAFATQVPLTWPRRTAGERWRIVVLLPANADSAAKGVTAAVTGLPRETCDVLLACVGAAAPAWVELAGISAARIIELPGQPDAAVAKGLAVADPDLLLDAAGPGATIGPLLAARPARAVWSLATGEVAHSPPLVDRVLDDASGLVAACAEAHAAHDPGADCPLGAAELAAAWEGAVRAHQRGERAAARAVYDRVLALEPGFAPAHFLSGMLAREDGDTTAARRDFDAAVAAESGYLDARVAAARAATEQHDAAAAIVLCRDGIERAPASVVLWRALGHAHLAHRDGAAAADAFAHALALAPTDAETHYNRGVALQMQRALPEAARAYQHALAFAPDLTTASFNLGVVCQEARADDAAIAAYEAALRSDPRHVAAYKNLGEVLFATGKYEAWLANFRRFEASCPAALPLAVQALEACQYQGEFAKLDRYLAGLAREEYRAADELELADCLEELLYLLLFFDVDPELVLRFAQTYDGTAKRVYGEPLPARAARRPGRLRIGYLSADLRDHVMGKMIWQAIRHHDRSRYELFFYALSRESDAWTDRFRGVADRFDVIADLSERDAAVRIAADDLDVLVDLSTHTRGAKPGILAFKPARVQITHVASAGPVGLSAVDFKLTDRYADVPGNQSFQLEMLLAMDGCVYPFRHIAPAGEHPFRRDRLGIPADAVVIGAFVSALKLSRRCLALWKDVLDRVPRALLACSPVNPAAQRLYLTIAGAAGIGADRVVFVPQGGDDAQNQARYTLVDFVLDPMPFGGVNGTIEALDMGVPVVTLAGRRHGERSGLSILSNLGVTETVAQSGTEYVDIAVRLATDAGFMAAVRAAIRRGIATSTLTDMPRHTQSLEAAYEAALAQKCPDVLAGALGPRV